MGLFDFFKKKLVKEDLLPEIIQLPYFGEIDKNSLDDYYAVSAKLDGVEIRLDLNFDKPKATTKKVEVIKSILENLGKLDIQNKVYISEDFYDENGETVKSYIVHHLNDCDEEELAPLVNSDSNSLSPLIQLLNKIKLHRVGIYPDSGDEFVTFDYAIGKGITQYLIVISTNQDGKLNYITMES